MKTILIATDFSEASWNASVYGAQLAKYFNAKLVLVSAYQQIPFPVDGSAAIVSSEAMRDMTQEQLKRTANDILREYKITADTACKEADATFWITECAEEYKADMIVVGMKEHGKGFRKIIGSTVTGLIKKSTKPLMVIPENTGYVPVERIALAYESDLKPDQDIHLTDILSEIATKFEARLFMVKVTKSSLHEAFEILNRPFKLNRMIRELNPVYEPTHGSDIPAALNEFINTHHINMLVAMPHRHSVFERLFTKSVTRATVFEIEIPLLLLPNG